MLKSLLLTFFILLSNNLYADIDEGKELFKGSNCLDCHSVEKFKYRKDKVNNFDKLHSTVNACSFNTDTGWFDEEIMNVSTYLNHHYYKFKIQEK